MEGYDDKPTSTPSAFLAGSIAGAVAAAVGHPIDTLKVYAQTQTKAPEQVRALFHGITLPVVTAGAVQSLNLGLYENIRRWLAVKTPAGQTRPLLCHGVAAATAGILISVITCPINRIKVHQQLSGGAFMTVARSVAGTKSLFRGWFMTVLFESSRGFYMISYVSIKCECACVLVPLHC